MSFEMSDEERLQLKFYLSEYLSKKPQEEQLKAQLKEIRDMRSNVHQHILQTMEHKSIPMCTSRDYGYNVSVVNKKRTAAPKPKELLDVLEELFGAEVRQKVEQEAKARYEVTKESKTLKLVKIDASGKRVAGSASGGPPAKRARTANKSEPSDAPPADAAPGALPPGALPPPRYNEEDNELESEEESDGF